MKLKKDFDIVRYNPQIDTGLSAEQVKERQEHKLFNKVKQKTGKSYFRIFFDNIFTFFNLIWILIFSALVAVESYNDLLFIVVIFLNTLISIIQECKAKSAVDKLSLLTMPKVSVTRQGETIEISADKLVLDDVIKLEIGNSIPADCIILSGKIEVNESLLTGESDAIKKAEGDSILSGSFIISGSCFAKVNKIGNQSYIQSIAHEAKKFKNPNSNLNKDLKTMIKYIGFGIIPIGGIMFMSNYFSYNHSLTYAVTKTGGALIGMIPAGMFLLVTIALSVGVVKLSKKKAMVKDPYSIEMLARSNVLCLDKTGTITDGTMQVNEIIKIDEVNNLKNEDIISNILYYQKTSNATSNALIREYGKKNKMKCIYNLEFSSQRKCTATSFEKYGTFVLGAPEFVKCTLTKKLKNTIFNLSSQGKRILMLAYKEGYVLDESEKLPRATTPLALIVIEDTIREDAKETIAWFKENGVQIKIISGDNPITVSNIAKRVGVENAENNISLENMSLQEVEKVATSFTVFGRVSPEQKHTLIKTLKKKGYVVAMTGDGVNDTLALKESDCSIAMADGSEVARSLSNLVLRDSKFSSLPAVVKEGRQVINNVQQSSTLFLMKTLFTILLSLFSIVTLSGYPFQPAQMFLLELFVIGLPSVILALQPNTNLIRGEFIPVVLKRSIPSGLLIFINVLGTIILARFKLINAEEFATLSTLVLIFTGYINLVFLCVPFSKIRIFCCTLSLVCLTTAIVLMGDFFGMTTINLKVALILVAFMAFSIPLHILIPKLIKKIEIRIKKAKLQKIEKKNKYNKKTKHIALSDSKNDAEIDEIDLQ